MGYSGALTVGIYATRNVSIKDIGSQASMVLQNYQNSIELTANMIYIVAFGGGLKRSHKIYVHLNIFGTIWTI